MPLPLVTTSNLASLTFALRQARIDNELQEAAGLIENLGVASAYELLTTS